MNSVFHRLSPNLQHGLVHVLGWRELRPVQELAFEALAEGANAVILAPTAGGKTEAAVLPVVDSLVRTPARGVGCLFLSPLRALLNNQEERVMKLAGLGGLTAFKWHGDVTSAQKADFTRAPADILMLTPESLEVILAVPRYDEATLFADLRFVIVDEVHAFVGGARGDHLVALLERVASCSSHDLQRIALSATVSNPELLLEWLHGSSRRPSRLVRPEALRTPRTVEFHPTRGQDDMPPIVRSLVRGRKSLVFAESRRFVERTREALTGTGIEPFVHHSSLSRDLREEAEAAFRSGDAACIICTSTLELGLDVGDLDLVVQRDAPSTVSSFVQRLGRTGRRPGTRGRLAFVTDDELGLVQAVALVSLALPGWVEPAEPSRRDAGVFVQQTLARALPQGIGRRVLVNGGGRPYCFADLTESEREQVLDHLEETGLLRTADSLVHLGETAERYFGGRNYIDLYSTFDASREMVVVTTHNRTIGTLETWFADSLKQKEFVFVLGGQPWLVVDADWERDRLVVKPAPAGRIPSWLGSPRLLSLRVCQEMQRLLLADDVPPFVGDPAAAMFRQQQAWFGRRLSAAEASLVEEEEATTFYTFAGGRINKVFQRLAEQRLGVRPVMSNWSLRLAGSATGEFLKMLDLLRTDAESVRAGLMRGLDVSQAAKFERYLPEALWREAVGGRLFDWEGAVAVAQRSPVLVSLA